MVRVIDLELNLPVADAWEAQAQNLIEQSQKGMGNYGNIFGPSHLKALGMTQQELDAARRDLPPSQFEEMLRAKMRAKAHPLDEFVREMDEAGVKRGLVDVAMDNVKTAEAVRQYPDRFIGLAWASPHQGMAAVRDLDRAVKDLGLKCLMLSPFRQMLRANDKKYYPLYAKAAELGIPVRVYCTMNYATDRPMDLGRPIFLDEVAIDFPELTIIAGLGGWPWVPEMVGLARRHPNVYIDLAAHRPKYLATPGAGWDMLMQFGNTLLQDKIVFASSWLTLGLPLKSVVNEFSRLPLKEEVMDKWLYRNAARIFGLE